MTPRPDWPVATQEVPWSRVLSLRPEELGFAPDEAVAVVLVDVDRLKAVNDIEGYGAGDALLATLIRRLHEWAGPRAVVVPVAGGLFGALVPELADPATAVTRAWRLHAELGRAVQLGDHDVTRPVSVGVAAGRISQLSIIELVHRADDALQVAQQSGGNTVVQYTEQMHADALARSQVELRLGDGVRDGQFEVYYQPEVELATGVITAVEALLRWHHPTLGLLGADRFIAISEQTGLVRELGRFALDAACRQRIEWLRADAALRYELRVNVSPRQLDDPGFVEVVADALRESGLPAQLLCLEVTETINPRDSATAADVLLQLRAMDVRIALDDFGTGHSSLRRLKTLPVDVLKIDREFVVEVAENPIDPIIVDGLVRLAAAWELEVVAEGVETLEGATALLRLGCRRAQGHWFGGPMTATAIAALLAAGRVDPALLPRRRPRPGPSAAGAAGEAGAPLG